jgi:hypothetical protein
MKNSPLIYLLTLNSPSRNALRLWTGRSVHTLRHCSATQIGRALVEMQKNVENLQQHLRTRTHGMEPLASVSPEEGG